MIIFHKDSPGRSLYMIESGKVRIFVLSTSGQEISVNVYGPGDVFGELALLSDLPRSAGAVVAEKATVLTLHRDDFLWHLERYPRMAKSVIAVLSQRLRYTTAYAESLAFLDVYSRVASKLLELAARYGVDQDGEIEIDFELTQSELASWVAATREHVNRVLGTLRDQELIKIQGADGHDCRSGRVAAAPPGVNNVGIDGQRSRSEGPQPWTLTNSEFFRLSGPTDCPTSVALYNGRLSAGRQETADPLTIRRIEA